jgi:branched-chain amino acid transport system ATP-binding protein
MDLKVEQLSKRFGAFYALRDVSLEVPTGKIVLLIGPNGSGKSTLINCVSGVYKPDGGTVWLDGIDLEKKKPHEILRLGMGRSFQIPSPFKALTVAENLLVCGQNHPGEGLFTSMLEKRWRRREDELIRKMLGILRAVDLQDKADTLAGELSGGQLKLLEIGRLLMLDAKLMLLDEPIGGVNPVLAHKILSQIQNIRDDFKVGFLTVEHRLDIILRYVDYVYALSQGKMIFQGPPNEVVNSKEVYDVYLGGHGS